MTTILLLWGVFNLVIAALNVRNAHRNMRNSRVDRDKARRAEYVVVKVDGNAIIRAVRKGRRDLS